MKDPLLDYRYIHLISHLLEGFKEVREGLYNFRCPLCGDSSHNSNKRRGYLIKKEEGWQFYCHNCTTSLPFFKFLMNVDNDIYKNYKLESFKKSDLTFTKHNPMANIKKFVLAPSYLTPLSNLSSDHQAVQYMKSRLLPEEKMKYIYWTDDYDKLVEKTIPNKYDVSLLPKSGIVFELKDLEGKITGYQIRSIDPNVPKAKRFVICSLTDKHDLFYTEPIDFTITNYVVEGCTDALFLSNCYAILSSSLYRVHLSDNTVYINDNEPRNKQIVEQVEKCIVAGYKTVLLPDIYEGMDVNDLVKSGISYTDLPKLYQQYTFSGLTAKLKFSRWRKV